MSDPLSPFLNHLASAGQMSLNLAGTELSLEVFEALVVSCAMPVLSERKRWQEPAAGPAPLAGAQQGGSRDLCGLGVCEHGMEEPTGASCRSLLTQQFVVFSKSPSWCRGCPEEVSTHGAGTSVSATQQLLTAPSLPAPFWKALPCLCPSDFLLLLLCNCQALHRAINKALATTFLVQGF